MSFYIDKRWSDSLLLDLCVDGPYLMKFNNLTFNVLFENKSENMSCIKTHNLFKITKISM